MNPLCTYLNERPKLGFVIVGAEKAGTTALFAYLRRAPSVYIPFNKELNFFDRDERYRDGSDFSALHRWFVFAPPGAIMGEATPNYLKNPLWLKRIHDYNPSIKVIALLRSPVHRAYSAWNYRRVRFRDQRDFLTAVRVEVESGGSLAIARENKYRYIGSGRYAEQVRGAQQIFPAGNLMLIKYEDFARDQMAYVREAARFIGAADPGEICRIRYANVWGYRRPMLKAEFDRVLALYEAEIDEVEALTGWDCSDWRKFDERSLQRDTLLGRQASRMPVHLPRLSH